MKKLVLALCALSLLGGSAPSFAAAQCHDKNGKFIKCPQAKPEQCRDKNGKFIKCPAAKPKTCRDAKGHYAKCK